MSSPRALFRCDASPAVGAGHVTRCLALAEALVDAGWRITFAVGRGTVAIVPAVGAKEFSVIEVAGDTHDEPALLQNSVPGTIDLLVVDHYQRDIHFEEACRGWARQILVLDDATGRQHDCDFLIDAAASDRTIYAGGVPAQARLLLGPDYALMRRAFVAKRAEALRHHDGRPVENILVSFGATDPWNVTPVALDALAEMANEFSITVALSSQAPHLDKVRDKLSGPMRLRLDADMPALMAGADFAVGAAGVSTYERAVLGLPSLIVTVADNQRGIMKIVTEAGGAIDAGPFDPTLAMRLLPIMQKLVAEPSARIRMSRVAASLVDGRGAQRLLVALAGPIMANSGVNVRLRLAEGDDEEWLLALQQMPEIRRHFRNPEAPGADEHAHWMARALANWNAMFLIIEADGERAGYLRLDRHDGGDAVFEISVAVCPKFHGQGIGSTALALGRRVRPAAVFNAEVFPQNVASTALFTRAGFHQVGLGRYQQRPLN